MRSPVAQVFATEWPRLVATLMRDLGDLGLAEDAAQDAFVEAANRWGPTTTPERPGAWLLTTARRKAIDQLRRRATLDSRVQILGARLEEADVPPDTSDLGDPQLAMVFGCCHPSLSTEAQVALTLRHVGGLSTAQIAAAFVVPEATMAKRLVRAKHKVRDANVPFTIPTTDRLTERLGAVLHVIYLIFTEGHTASDASQGATDASHGEQVGASASLVRGSLCDEARWLSRLVADLLPGEPEANGLAALLCFTDARRAARVDAAGDIVLLADQSRDLWDAVAIEEGHRRLEAALRCDSVGPYQLQAAIAAVHSLATTAEDTDWTHIVALYQRLREFGDSPIVELNAAVAEAMIHGPAHGLARIDNIAANTDLDQYRYLSAARADMLRQLERWPEAEAAYRAAIEVSENPAELRFLNRRLASVLAAGVRTQQR